LSFMLLGGRFPVTRNVSSLESTTFTGLPVILARSAAIIV